MHHRLKKSPSRYVLHDTILEWVVLANKDWQKKLDLDLFSASSFKRS